MSQATNSPSTDAFINVAIKPKTLLVTSTRPGSGSVGELFLGRLCKLFPHDKLSCIAGVANYDIPVSDPELSWLNIETFALPPEYPRHYASENVLSKLKRQFFQIEILSAELQQRVDAILSKIKSESIELLWFVLNSPSMVLIADAVLAKSDISAIAIVWDPIGSIVEQSGMPQTAKDKLKAASDRVMKRLKACGVASYGMKDYLTRYNNLETRVLINTPERQNVERTLAEDKLVIAFAGSAYARDEFELLLMALNSCNWRKAERDIELRIFSNSFDVPFYAGGKKMNVSFKGHVSEQELFQELASCHVAYLPYWFDKKFEEAVTRCFPNKLATYVVASCPVLFHGPEKSSPSSFLKKYKVGVSVHTMDVEDLMRKIKYLTIDNSFLSDYQSVRNKALSEELNADIFSSRFNDLVKIAKIK